jgi:hypothetical protein
MAELGTAHTDRSVAQFPAGKAALINTRQAIENCLPYHVKRPNGSRYKRMARIEWLRMVTGDPGLQSSAELTNGQAWRIGYWFEGKQPRTGLSEDGETESARTIEVINWFIEHHETIMTLVYRDRSLTTGGKPFGK